MEVFFRRTNIERFREEALESNDGIDFVQTVFQAYPWQGSGNDQKGAGMAVQVPGKSKRRRRFISEGVKTFDRFNTLTRRWEVPVFVGTFVVWLYDGVVGGVKADRTHQT